MEAGQPPFAHGRARCAHFSSTASVAFLITVAASAQTYQLVYSFRNLGEARAGLIQASDGNLYGTTHFGGTSGVGTIFRVDAAGEFRTLHSFGHADGAFPDAELIEAADGNFYGTTSRGGAANRGAVFRMNASGRVERLHSFAGPDGATPVAALVQASDGNFYGTTSEGGAAEKGTVFRISSSGSFESLHEFVESDGAKPSAALIQATDGNFYGTTVEGGIDGQGTLFQMDSAGSLSTVRNLTWDDGIHPYAALLQASDGNFYGTASEGGANSQGTIFRLGSTGDFVRLHSFNFDRYSLSDGAQPYAALIEGGDGALYGTTALGGNGTDYMEGWGAIFKADLSGNVTILHRFAGTDGQAPHAGVVQRLDGSLYGTTPASGEWFYQRGGTVFRLDSSSLTTLHEFPASEGDSPMELIQASDGKFYGMTFGGGSESNGTIFRVTPSGAFTTLHDFMGIEGWGAQAALLEASDGYLYGSTLTGGKNGLGAIFRTDLSGHVTLVHEFSGPDGMGPASALIQASDGYLYGTAANGGDSDDNGTIFRMGFDGQWQTMHVFNGADGGGPRGALLEASDGKFYGTTWGPRYHGTVFRISNEAEFESLHTFNGYDGVYPYDALIQATDGDFYSTTYGSIPGFGTVFKIDSSGSVTTLHRFEIPEAYAPRAGLIQASDGDLYGTTGAGGVDNGLSGYGTAFRMTLGGDLTLIHLFNGFDGAGPSSKMIEASDGSLWGTADLGPLGGRGIIYRFSSEAVAVNGILPTSGPASEETAVQLFGGGFTPEATVAIGGDTGTEVTVADPTFLYLFTPTLAPGTLNDVSVTVPDPTLGASTGTLPNAFFTDFLDVPQLDPFHDYIEKIVRNGVTAGCGGGNYCPQDAVTRAQMAVFLLKSKHGADYAPPSCTGVFGDVPCPSMFADWIEQLAAEGITAGCGGGNYCPLSPVTRAQMSVFLLKAKHGPGYAPPPCSGLFLDVPCPSLFADWIEQLAAEEVTIGCGGGNYCPGNPNTRAQMSAFLVKALAL